LQRTKTQAPTPSAAAAARFRPDSTKTVALEGLQNPHDVLGNARTRNVANNSDRKQGLKVTQKRDRGLPDSAHKRARLPCCLGAIAGANYCNAGPARPQCHRTAAETGQTSRQRPFCQMRRWLFANWRSIPRARVGGQVRVRHQPARAAGPCASRQKSQRTQPHTTPAYR
jgi:hypothetical protein